MYATTGNITAYYKTLNPEISIPYSLFLTLGNIGMIHWILDVFELYFSLTSNFTGNCSASRMEYFIKWD